jgi:K+-sensing histidine kinase KdpD
VAYIDWKVEYSVDNATIDKQHQALFDLVNEVADKVKTGNMPEIKDVVNRLAAYTVQHFRDEEAIMKRAGYKSLEDHQMVHIHFWSGPLGALALTVLLILGSSLGHRIPNPNLLFALVLVVSAYLGGRASGLVTAIIAITFTAYDWTIPGQPFSYTPENFQRLIIVVLAMPTMALLVGLLKTRAESQQQTIAHYLALEQARNQELVLALAQVEHLEGTLSVCAWCHKVREEDGNWVNLEQRLAEKHGTEISHGICPECRPVFRAGSSQ